MRKVQSAPQLTSLPGSPLNTLRRPSVIGERLLNRLNRHAPRLPSRDRPSVTTQASLLEFFALSDGALHQLTTVTQDVEREMVLESETNSVSVAAAFCFAEFGTPSSYDAPDLTTTSSSDNLTENELNLAACLATPFEGNPQEDDANTFPELEPCLKSEEEFISLEFERKHLRALGLNRRRQRTLVDMIIRSGPVRAALLRLVYLFASRKAFNDFVFRN